MNLIADILLAAGALGAGVYCMVLARRLKRFNDLEKGVGGAVAVLSVQVDDLTKTLAAAQKTANGSSEELSVLAERAERISKNLELQLASMHDLPRAVPNGRAEQSAVAQTSAEPMFVRHRATEAHQ